MSDAPDTSVITIDEHAIEYRLERRGDATVLILHGGHMSARSDSARNLRRYGLLGARRFTPWLWPNSCRCRTIGT
jgi:hypothetical protein